MRLVQSDFLALSKEVLGRGYHLRFQVEGTSMRPTIWPGDIITIDPDRKVQPGDIIFYHHQGHFLAHRLVACQAGMLLTKGDDSDHPDSPFPDTALLGKVIQVERPRPGLSSAAGRRRLYHYLVYWLQCRWPWIYHLGRRLKNSGRVCRPLWTGKSNLKNVPR